MKQFNTAPRFALCGAMLLAGGFFALPQSAVAAPLSPYGKLFAPYAPDEDHKAGALKTLLDAAISSSDVTVTVQSIIDGSYIAVLSGELADQAAVRIAGQRARKLVMQGKLTNVSLINTLHTKENPQPQDMVSYLWPLSYLQSDSKFQNAVTLSDLTAALNALFPVPQGCPVTVTAQNINLWLQGPPETVAAVRALLAMIDAPAPQVRLEMWGIQYTGSQSDISSRMTQLDKDIRRSQNLAELALLSLVEAMKDAPFAVNENPSLQALTRVGFRAHLDSNPSLIEALISLGACPVRNDLLKGAEANFKKHWPDCPEHPFATLCDLLPNSLARPTGGATNVLPTAPQTENADAKSGRRTQKVSRSFDLTGNTQDTNPNHDTYADDMRSIQNFVTSLENYYLFLDATGLNGASVVTNPDAILKECANAPEELARDSIVMNRFIEQLVSAYTQDMQDAIFQPLLKRAQKGYGINSGGVGFVGKTDVVVTSRAAASITSTLQTYYEQSTPKTLNEDFFNRVFPAAVPLSTTPVTTTDATASGATTPTQGNNPNLTGLLAAANPLQTALVEAALQGTADTSFHGLAPGISLNILPAMTPDGTTAALVLNVTFGVDTTVTPDNGASAISFRPPDAVKAHTTTTVETVRGFNLFDVSSFDTSAIYPRAPFIVPVLGNLPIIGNMFRFSHAARKTNFHSVILTNATLLPRSLGLVGFYGNNQGSKALVKRIADYRRQAAPDAASRDPGK